MAERYSQNRKVSQVPPSFAQLIEGLFTLSHTSSNDTRLERTLFSALFSIRRDINVTNETDY